jgi:multiple sugar transport system substrate-binding protein
MKAQRLLIALLAGVMLLALLTPAAAQDVPTIRISTWAGVDEAAEFQTIIDKVNAENSDFQVVQEPVPSDYYTQVQTQLAGGTAADLMWIDQDHMGWAADGVFAPLTDCVANAEPGTAGDQTDYYPGIISTAIQDGVLYGLPWIAAPVVLYYNKALFDAADLDYPTADWTWDDFMAAAKALTKDTDGDGTPDQYGFSANGWPPPHMFIWQAGGDVIGDDKATSPIDSPEALAGMDYYLQLAYNPEVSPSRDVIAEQGFGEMFKAGKVAMFMGGAADDLDRVEGLDTGVVSVPHNPTTGLNTTFAWSASTVINASSEVDPALLCKALIALTEGVQNWKIVSPRISQTSVEHLVASEPRKEASAEAILGAVPSMRAFSIVPRYAEWNDAFWTQYANPLILRETDRTPEELAAEVRPALEEFLPVATQ